MATIDDQVAALTARLNLIDGQNLATNMTGFTDSTNSKIAGLKSDVQGFVLALEASINTLTQAVSTLTTTVNSLVGTTSSSSSGTETPPSV